MKCRSSSASSENPPAAPGGDVEEEAGTTPARVLLAVYVEGHAAERAELQVVRARGELAGPRHIGELPSQQPPDWKRQRPVRGPQALDQRRAPPASR